MAHVSPSPSTPSPPSPPVTAGIRRWRIGLVVVGLLLLAIGGIVLVNDVSPKKYVGIVIWFAGALIVHDGIVSPLVFAFGLGLRRMGKRIPFAVLALVQGAIVIALLVALIVVPEILKKKIGSANPTILPLDYGPHLAVFFASLVVLTALAAAVYLLVAARRQKLRRLETQD
jgi:hypothetical protein